MCQIVNAVFAFAVRSFLVRFSFVTTFASAILPYNLNFILLCLKVT